MRDTSNELHFGSPECLVAAKHLVDGVTFVQSAGGYVEYFHVLFDHHEILNCNGVEAESFHPAKQGELMLSSKDCAEITAIFPKLNDGFDNFGPTARPVLSGYEAQMIRNVLEYPMKAA